MSTQIKRYYLACFIVFFISCNVNDPQRQYSEGKDIFYNHCTSCHLVQGRIDIDTSLKMSSISLQKMSSLKTSLAALKSQLKDSSHHEAIRDKVSEKEIENIRYFILHSSDPKSQK